MHLLIWAMVGWVTLPVLAVFSYMYLHMFVCSERTHVECVMKDNVAVVRLNSPNNKVYCTYMSQYPLK